MLDVAGMAAVLSLGAPVNRKGPAAVCTDDLPDRPAVNLIEMGIPPLVSALVRAELLFFPASLLGDRRPTAQAPMLTRTSDRLILLLCVPAAEGFYCIF